MPDKKERSTASNYYVSQFYHLAKQRELDADRLLLDAGIGPDVVDSPEVRVDAGRFAMVVQGLWDALQDESMSLSTSPIPRGSFVMMGKLTVHERNLGKALTLGFRFYNMITRAFKMELVVEDDLATVKFQLKEPRMDANHLLAEINLMAWHRYASWLITENVPLIEVFFDYPTPNQVAEYAYLFPGKHVFSAPFMGFSFPGKFLESENVQNSASLKSFMKRCFSSPRLTLACLPTCNFCW